MVPTRMGAPLPQATVETWIQEQGLETEPVTLDAGSGYTWALAVRGQPFTMLVAQKAVEHSHLFLQVRITVSEPHAQALRDLPEQKRLLFAHDLRIGLLQQAVGHGIDYAEEDPTMPTSVLFGYNVLEDSLQRAGFFRRNHQMQSAALLAAQYFQKVALLGDWP
ncbi:MAG: DUF2299 family protein [Dehalococcoidia bacterium]